MMLTVHHWPKFEFGFAWFKQFLGLPEHQNAPTPEVSSNINNIVPTNVYQPSETTPIAYARTGELCPLFIGLRHFPSVPHQAVFGSDWLAAATGLMIEEIFFPWISLDFVEVIMVKTENPRKKEKDATRCVIM